MMLQQDMEKRLSQDRFAPYLQAAGGNPERGMELYRWNTELSGALHAQLSNVEILTRNAIDTALRQYNFRIMQTENWTERNEAAPHIYSIMRKPLETARKYAGQASTRRRVGHPRKNAPVTHSDCVSQLTFGNWCALLGEDPPIFRATAKELWRDGLKLAFPEVDPGDTSRETIGKRLFRLHQLRNRVAHHENLLEAKVNRRFNDMIALVATIDRTYPSWTVEGSLVRKIAKEDPRKKWSRGGSRNVAWR